MAAYNVVLTTFETVRKEYMVYNDVFSARTALLAGELLRPLPRRDSYPLMVLRWSAIFVDEVACISRSTSITSVALRAVEACKRFGFTSTPLENDYTELQTLTKFLQVAPWKDTERFEEVCLVSHAYPSSKVHFCPLLCPIACPIACDLHILSIREESKETEEEAKQT